MNKKITSSIAAAIDIREVELPLSVVLTCCTCYTTYEPTAEDWAWRRTSCPNPHCDRGWIWTAELRDPAEVV